jgi:low temperature requirement protein LtrA
MAQDRTHRLTRMTGRDPHESHRAATPLELLYDLTFVIGFGVAADELAHALAADHVAVGLGGFAFAMFAVVWAWIQYTWFASAYDTDDWICRLMVMVQMLGVVILALGLPDMFASLEHGDRLDNRVMVLGYVVMRVPMVAMWLRAARADSTHHRAPMVYVATIVVSQVIWCWIALAEMSIRTTFLVMIVPLLIELGGPLFGERMASDQRIPWHAHHIAERYGLLVIIALGEGLLGTVAALSAIVGPGGPGWTWDVAVISFAGVALIFGMWWIYFVLPSGDLLERHRGRGLLWGYSHFPLLAALVAVGAGLHVAAYFVEHHSELGIFATVLTVAVPLAAYVLGVFALYALITLTFDPFHLVLLAVTAAVVVAGVLMAQAGVSLEWCLLVLAATPWVTVVGYETIGHRHGEAVLAAG